MLPLPLGLRQTLCNGNFGHADIWGVDHQNNRNDAGGSSGQGVMPYIPIYEVPFIWCKSFDTKYRCHRQLRGLVADILPLGILDVQIIALSARKSQWDWPGGAAHHLLPTTAGARGLKGTQLPIITPGQHHSQGCSSPFRATIRGANASLLFSKYPHKSLKTAAPWLRRGESSWV